MSQTLSFAAPVPLRQHLFISSSSVARPPSQAHLRVLHATATPSSKPLPSPPQDAVPKVTNPSVPLPRNQSQVEADPPPQLPPIPPNAVPYFAYFANMNPRKIGPLSRVPLRRFPLLYSVPAVLPHHRLVIDVPGLPPEPAFANVLPSHGSQVHGVLHWLSPADFASLSLSEGYGAVPFPTGVSLEEVTLRVTLKDGGETEVAGKTFVFQNRMPTEWQRLVKPSRRYVQVAVDGAEYWGLDQKYIDNVLRRIPYANGLLGGFGLFVEPRPHLLDRPNPAEEFGKPGLEIFSPFQPFKSQDVLRRVTQQDEREKAGRTQETKLRLMRMSVGGRRKLYFIPGIDGTGKGILSQVAGFEEDGEWEVSSVIYPHANRQGIQEIAGDLIDMFLADGGGGPVTLVGESMGGATLLALTLENAKRKQQGEDSLDIDLALLINPATCYDRSTPKALWDFLLQLGLSAEVYAGLLPPVLLPFVVDLDNVREEFGPSLVPRLRKILFSLSSVADVLPQDALMHRVDLLANLSVESCDLAVLSSEFGPKQFGVISCANDNLLPSLSENHRLRRYIPNMYSCVLSYGGHVPMLDSRFSLVDMMKPFKNVAAKSKGEVPKRNANARLEKRREALSRRLIQKYSGPEVSAVKSRVEMRRVIDYLGELNSCSPVFIGEENLPTPKEGRPVLFVCNHTIMGWADAMFPLLRLQETKKILLRPLAHPILFLLESTRLPGAPQATNKDMTDYGVVQVSPSSLLEMFAKGQWTLLFPGGASEALRIGGAGRYELLWPESPEFVRACALFGATVIPMATVGVDDMVDVIVDSQTVSKYGEKINDLLGNPLDTDTFRDRVRRWRESDPNKEVVMAPPVMRRSGPERIYFRFGKPIEVPGECYDDPVLEKKYYDDIRNGVADGLEILLRRRESDSFRSLEERIKFANANGTNVQPPASPAWSWCVGQDAYLDEELQPSLRHDTSP
eukprot:GFKZ01011320.1.p1 GENE.GFKZ01011320.1~~GFKZ01011320.1.p1  ORF type:complete len:963 (+),score=125.67 GFKZ01011320.1:130-3018(+)